MLRLIRVRRSASRVLAVAAAMSATLMVPVAVSAAAVPAGTAASSATAEAGAHSATAAQIFGLPVVTAAWAVLGLVALICGLAFASRGARSFQAEPQLAAGTAAVAPAASTTVAAGADRPAARFGQSVAQSAHAAQHSLSNSLRLPDHRSEAQAAI